VVAGRDWHKLVAVDLTIGRIVWQQELGAKPITAAEVANGSVVLTQGGAKRWFNVFTGKEDRSFEKVGMPRADTL
jgi:outer membrane protein assembly factor BamB